MNEIDHEAAKRAAIEYDLSATLAGLPNTNTCVNLSRSYLDMVAQLAAERARVEALCDVIYDANGVAYPFEEMQNKMTTILEGRTAHAHGDEA